MPSDLGGKITMRDDPPDFDYSEYDEDPDTGSISSKVMKAGHIALEEAFGKSDNFESVIEVGTGYGGHYNLIRHQFKDYTMTDYGDYCLSVLNHKYAQDEKVKIIKEDATQLSFADNSFDRLIACHVLEHLPEPHNVLKEWYRVVKPGGVISILLPTDPGLAWRFARIFARRKAIAIGMEYDYVMAREHINSINNLVSLIHYYFEQTTERWYPFHLPSMDINLFYCCHIKRI
jgi:phosphatidylethanolamine/phosphatidyl-N-methylethanolamine N-methyltransferase